MDFTFTEEQTLLRDSVSGYLQRHYDVDARRAVVRSEAGWSPEVWRGLGELGLLALPFPEEAGGYGGSIVDVVAISELFGAHLLVEPYLASVVLAGGALAALPDHADAARRLEGILAGTALGAFAHEEGPGTPDPTLVSTRAEQRGDAYALSGEKKLVLHGAEADVLLVSARLHGGPGDADGLALLAVEPGSPGVTATPFVTVDGRRAAHLRFDGAAAQLLAADAHALLRRVTDHAIVVLAAEAVGAMGELLRRTADYASTREQFGVAIGTFQAVAHRLADMKIAHVKARSSLLYTAALVEAGRATPYDISVLKAQTGRLGRLIGESAIQTHGGIGMTDELTVGHLHKRVLAVDAMFGSADHHLRTVGAGRREPLAAPAS